jgi:hypothetical protein
MPTFTNISSITLYNKCHNPMKIGSTYPSRRLDQVKHIEECETKVVKIIKLAKIHDII